VVDVSKFESRLGEDRKTSEQTLFESVLAAAVAADRQGLFLEPQVVMDQDASLEKESVELVWGSTKFQRALVDRGIRSTSNPNLTLRQETFLQAYLNPLNLLTPQVLAKRMKIGLSELDGWLRQKEFASAFRVKAEENLQKFIPMADAALGQLVQQGDMRAITFVNQLTGRFDPNAKQSVDVPSLLLQVQDIILRHVQDASVKRNIARELIAMASGVSHLGVVSEPVSGKIEVEADFVVEDES
jgi:hypothetical protein